MPALSPTMESGKILKWHYKVGDEVTEGDAIADIETDKSTMGFEMTDVGYVAKLLYPEGDEDIPTGTAMAIIVEEKEDIEKFANYKNAPAQDQSTPAQEEPVSAPEPVTQTPQEEGKATTSGQEPESSTAQNVAAPMKEYSPEMMTLPLGQGTDRVFMSPLAKRLAGEHGVELSALKGLGTGTDGVVTASDVENYVASSKSQVAKSAPVQTTAPTHTPTHTPTQQVYEPVSTDIFEDLKISTMRKVIASRLLESKQTIPHYYLNIDCQMDNLIALRKT